MTDLNKRLAAKAAVAWCGTSVTASAATTEEMVTVMLDAQAAKIAHCGEIIAATYAPVLEAYAEHLAAADALKSHVAIDYPDHSTWFDRHDELKKRLTDKRAALDAVLESEVSDE